MTVSPDQKAIVSRAAFERGAIITSYAQVEFLLADLVVRCRQRPEYQGVYDRFPYKLADRIKAARKFFAATGPLHRWRDQAEPLLDGLLSYEELRHMMAHGLLIVKVTPSNQHILEYRLYRPSGKDDLEAGFLATDLEQLGRASFAIGKYANEFVTLWRDIYMAEGLEPTI